MSLWDTDIQMFKPNVTRSVVDKVVKLGDMRDSFRSPSSSMQKVFTRLRQAQTDSDEQLRHKIKKKNIPFYVISAKVNNKREYADIKSFNPIAIIEFDNITKPVAVEMKTQIFYCMPSCAMAWISPSGNGAKFIFRIPTPASIKEYKEYWYGLSYIFEGIYGFDTSNVNCVLPLFASYDPNLLCRDNPSEFDLRGVNESEFVALSDKEIKKILSEAKPCPLWYKKKQVNKIKQKIESIDGNGFPQVRSISVWAGGLFAGGVGDSRGRWINFLENLITNNKYLSTSGGDSKLNVYIRTMKSAFDVGTRNPITYG